MDYLLTDELAKKWGVSSTRIRVMAKEGKIKGARLIGNTWTFPLDVEKPLDKRRKAAKAEQGEPSFSFPLFLLRRQDESRLNEEQRHYLKCEKLHQDLDFLQAYHGFRQIASSSSDTSLLAGCYYYLCQSSVMLEKYDEAFHYCRKLSALLSHDVPYQKELVFLLWELRTLTHDRSFIVPEWKDVHLYHPSSAPEMILIQSYLAALHSFKTEKPIDLSSFEMNALVFDAEDYPLTNVYLHLHLGMVCGFNKNIDLKCYHLRRALDAAIKHHLYYAVINYWNMFADIFSKIDSDYSPLILEKIHKANAQFIRTDQEIRLRANQSSIPFLSQEDHAFMTYLLEGLTTEKVAKIKGTSEKTIYKRYSSLRSKFDAKNKKELLEKYRLLNWTP